MRKIEYVVSNERLITPSGLSLVGQVLGKSDFENVNEFHTDEEFYKNSLGIAYGIPSESSLRNRLDGIGAAWNWRTVYRAERMSDILKQETG